MKQMQPRF